MHSTAGIITMESSSHNLEARLEHTKAVSIPTAMLALL
jgi:hypothetical protein